MSTNINLYIQEPINKLLANYLKNISIKVGIPLTEKIDTNTIIFTSNISDTNYKNPTILFSEKNLKLFFKNVEKMTLEHHTEFKNIDLLIIEAISLLTEKNPLSSFFLKESYIKKIMRFLQSMIVNMEVEDEESNMSHSQRVAYYTKKFSTYLNNSSDETKRLTDLAMIHDIGRIGLEQLMLFTPTRLNNFESWEMEHTITGSIFLSSLEELWFAIPVVRGHHELWNGTGFPDGLSGKEIPYDARLIGIIDWFDLVTHTATSEYEGITTPYEAVQIMENKKGVFFDPEIAEKFIKFINILIENNKIV